MRVSRRSHLSRIASDDEWLEGSWWEDGSLKVRPSGPQEQRQDLHGPQLAQPAAPAPRQDAGDTPLIDPRLAAGTKTETRRSRRRKKE